VRASVESASLAVGFGIASAAGVIRALFGAPLLVGTAVGLAAFVMAGLQLRLGSVELSSGLVARESEMTEPLGQTATVLVSAPFPILGVVVAAVVPAEIAPIISGVAAAMAVRLAFDLRAIRVRERDIGGILLLSGAFVPYRRRETIAVADGNVT
jgi:hypothetical protein